MINDNESSAIMSTGFPSQHFVCSTCSPLLWFTCRPTNCSRLFFIQNFYCALVSFVPQDGEMNTLVECLVHMVVGEDAVVVHITIAVEDTTPIMKGRTLVTVDPDGDLLRRMGMMV